MKSSGVDLSDVGMKLWEFQANPNHLCGVNDQNEKEANYYVGDCKVGKSPDWIVVIETITLVLL